MTQSLGNESSKFDDRGEAQMFCVMCKPMQTCQESCSVQSASQGETEQPPPAVGRRKKLKPPEAPLDLTTRKKGAPCCTLHPNPRIEKPSGADNEERRNWLLTTDLLVNHRRLVAALFCFVCPSRCPLNEVKPSMRRNEFENPTDHRAKK